MDTLDPSSPGAAARGWAALRGALAAAVELGAPACCAACGRLVDEGPRPGARAPAAPGTPVASPGRRAACPACAVALDGLWFAEGPRHVRLAGVPTRGPLLVPVTAAGPYRGAARAFLHAYKDEERRDVGPLLAPGLLAAVLVALDDPVGPLAPSLPDGARAAGPLRAVGDAAQVVLVPAPSARATERRRGDRPVELLAHSAARASGGRLVVRRLLRAGRPLADQATLGRAGRARNVAGAFVVRPGPPTGPVVVVDDVVTTGATLAECVRALVAAGHPVVAAAAVLATPSPGEHAGGHPGGPGEGRDTPG